MSNDIEWMKVSGVLIQGHQVASGKASDTPFPAGTIALQAPFFKERGIDLSDFYMGTLNVDVSPAKFDILSPAALVEKLKWINNFPAETFSFCDIKVYYKEQVYPGYLYFPHPETKTQHFHPPHLMEILTVKIPEISYGDAVTLEYNPLQLQIN